MNRRQWIGAVVLCLLALRHAGVAEESVTARIRSATAPVGVAAAGHVPGQLVVKLRPGALALDPVGSPEQAATAIASSTFGDAATAAFRARIDRYQARFVRRLGAPPVVRAAVAPTAASVREEVASRFRAAQQRFPTRARRAPPGAQAPDLSTIYLVEVPAAAVAAAAADLARDPHVVFAHPNHRLELFATPLPDVPYVPRDDFVTQDGFTWHEGAWGQAYPDLWGLERIQAVEAWNLFGDPPAAPGRGVVVAVVDTGLDISHPDIADNVWVNPGEDLNANGRVDGADACPIPNGDFNCVDDDGDGFADDVYGWDFLAGRSEPRDGYGHGTHCAGIIAAAAGSSGMVGAAPNARIMPLKIFDDEGGFASCATAVDAIVYLSDEGADIASNSWGGYAGDCPEIEDALNYATSLGVVVVAAAGNAAANVALFMPAVYPACIAVGASDQADGLTAFTNRGAGIDVVAPGGGVPESDALAQRNILSLLAAGSVLADDPDFAPLRIGDRFIRLAGTSMAAPQVVGAAAVLLSWRPDLTVEQVRQALRQSADDVAEPGWDEETGFGRLNLRGALSLPPLPTARFLDLTQEPHLLGAAPITFAVAPGSSATDRWALRYQSADGSAAPRTIAEGDGTPAGLATVDWDVTAIPPGSYWILLDVADGDGCVGADVRKLERSLYAPRKLEAQALARPATFAVGPGDFDADGATDLFFCNASGPPENPLDVRPQLLINDGSGGFADRSGRLPPTADGICVDTEVADFDGDGALDLFLVKGNASIGHRLLMNAGNAEFVDESASRLPPLLPSDLAFHGSAAGDVDGDGDVDIFVADPVALLINDGTGFFSDQRASRIPWLARCPHRNICAMALADVDRDGDLDLISYGGIGINDGRGVFRMERATVGDEYLDVGDINGDDFPDVVLSGPSTGEVQALLNDGTGVFPSDPFVLTANGASVPRLVDLDQDCDLDLLTTSNVLLRPVQAFLNDGQGRFTPAPGEHFLHPFASAAAAVADLDGGYDEIVVAGVWDDTVILKARWDDFPRCTGDCDDDGLVHVSELTKLVAVALDVAPLCACRAGDASGDARITIEELVGAVGNALESCAPIGATVIP